MEIMLDCIPCMLKQVLESSRMVTADIKLQEKIMVEALSVLLEYKQYRSSPKLVREIHQIIKKLTDEKDAKATITYGVRNEPILNDATEIEAYESGLGEVSTIVSTGCNALGTILDECSAEFLEIYNRADIIISKGQGNYETLSEMRGNLFFLLKAKCPMIASKLNVKLNEYVLRYSGS